MKAHYMMYISKIFDNLYGCIPKKDKGIVFIKHYNTLNISESDVMELVHNDEQVELLYHEFDMSELQDTYEPWFEWIRVLYYKHFSNVTPEAFIERCGVYRLHRSLFVSYLDNKFCYRAEDMVIIETEYEKRKFLDSLMSVILYIAHKQKLFLVLNKIHLADYSTLMFLDRFIKGGNRENISVVATYNDVFTVPYYVQGIWAQLIQSVESQNLLFDWSMQDKQAVLESNNAFVPDPNRMDEYIRKCNNLVMTMSLQQAIVHLEVLYNKIANEKMEVSEEYKFKIFYLYAYACLCKREDSMALHICENINGLSLVNESLEYGFNYYYLISLVQIYVSQIKIAQKNIQECFRLAELIREETGSEFFIFKSELIDCMSKFEGWRALFLCAFEFEIEEEFLVRLRDHGYLNHLAYIYSFGFENTEEYYRNSKDILNDMVYMRKGISLAEELGNYNLIVEAYKKCITICSSYGYCEPVDFYYNKCLEINQNDNNPIEEANIYNGLGYNRILSEKYNRANDYFNRAIGKTYEMKLPEQIGETLYNMSMNAFMAGEYQVASDFMIASIKVIQFLGIRRLRVCNITKMYGIIAISNHYVGVEYNCYLYLSLLKRVVSHLIGEVESEDLYRFWDDDLFLYYMSNALVKMKEGVFEEVEISFERAKFHMGRSTGILFFGYSIYAIELAKFYRIKGEEERALEVLNECINYCESKGYSNKVEILYAELYGNKVIKKKCDFTLTEVSLDKIYDLATNAGIARNVKRKEKDISFLAMWQDLLNRDSANDEDFLIQSAINALQTNYGVDRTLYIELLPDGYVIRYVDEGIEYSDEVICAIIEKMNLLNREFVADRISRTFEEYDDIISLFGKNQVVSILGIINEIDQNSKSILISYVTMYENFSNRQVMLDENNLILFKCAFKQLVNSVERLRDIKKIEQINDELSNMNIKLQKLAVTDQLTKLMNRQGLSKKLEEESSGWVYSNRNIYILYMDLDNFKYYNDRFGHNIGDRILIETAEVFRKLIGQDGYPVRYGGDEFVVILPFSTEAQAKEYAMSIHFELSKDEFFEKVGVDEHERAIAEKSGKKLSCSVGIAKAEDNGIDSIFNAIKNADDALYSVKKKTKGSYMVWSE